MHETFESGHFAQRLRELRQVLGDDPVVVGPYEFRSASGDFVRRARGPGLEGFFYTKLELEREGHGDVVLAQQPSYGGYFHALLSPFAWTRPLEEALRVALSSDGPPRARNAQLDALLVREIGAMREELRRLDPSLWIREAGIYVILARAYNRLRPGRSFFDSLDDDELCRIRERTACNTIWLLDIFEIGAINRWGTGGGSPYSLRGYRIKEELGGVEGFARFVARARGAGFEVGVDEVTNHVSLDSDQVTTYPESVIHIVPPQPAEHEDREAYRRRILGPVPFRGKDRVFWLVHTERYPEGGRRVPKWILVHHPFPDIEDIWTDMAQRDFSCPITREWELGEVRRLVQDLGVRLVRRDMAYEVLNGRYYKRWHRALVAERERAGAAWLRAEYDRLLVGFEARWRALSGRELLQEAREVMRRADPAATTIEEAYANFADLNRTGAGAVYNKVGLYDAQVSRDARRIRAELRNVAFRIWQVGGAGLLNFIGTHDGGEGNPVDKFGIHVGAAAIHALMFRPVLVYNGLEQGVGQKQNIIADLSRSIDTDKAIPFDIPARIDWTQSNPALGDYFKLVLSKGVEHRALFRDGAIQVHEPFEETPLVVWSAGRVKPDGSREAILAAANYAGGRARASFRMGSPILEAFGAFAPRPGHTYLFRDVLRRGSDGRPSVFTYEGTDLLERGLLLELGVGEVRFYEIEERAERLPDGEARA
ncbi:hypothetical protein [Polyangium sp. 6x1]|uniref:hypothetical protein n=1 Tax=Polyangium sp. 6x1 TaxID=3042689 RepID=UPI0024826EBD|nr:hypothetical protein [Polyangium sp. 6x1]MDI1443030.1 hypothetical protein [Polyangium sp. 6x1]